MARVRRQGRPRRKRQWLGLGENVGWTDVAASGNVVYATLGATEYEGAGLTNPTLVRVRGVGCVSAGDAENLLFERSAVGILVVPGVLLGAAATAFPSPLDDPEEDWLWHRYTPIASPPIGGESSETTYGASTDRFDIDSKAMRILRGDAGLALVFDKAGDSALDLNVQFSTRCLFQE